VFYRYNDRDAYLQAHARIVAERGADERTAGERTTGERTAGKRSAGASEGAS